jgi:hypothetical protein
MSAWIALGALAPVLCCLRCAAAEAPSEAQIRLHALALNGILDSLNGRSHTSLAYLYDLKGGNDGADAVKSMLSESWGITSREGLIKMLNDFESGTTGHRGRYWRIRLAVLRHQPEHYIDVFGEMNEGDAAAVHIVLQHIDKPLGPGLPITAWDFGRYINLCRSGFNAGLLSQSEAWDRIVPAARLLQASYSSWDEYAADYLIGRNFWNAGSILENEMIRGLIKGLERPGAGLWASIPWNESLVDGPVLEDGLATRLLKDYVPRNQNFPLPSRHISDEEQADVDRKTGVGTR